MGGKHSSPRGGCAQWFRAARTNLPWPGAPTRREREGGRGTPEPSCGWVQERHELQANFKRALCPGVTLVSSPQARLVRLHPRHLVTRRQGLLQHLPIKQTHLQKVTRVSLPYSRVCGQGRGLGWASLSARSMYKGESRTAVFSIPPLQGPVSTQAEVWGQPRQRHIAERWESQLTRKT